MDPTVKTRDRRQEKISDRCLWFDKAAMHADPLTKKKIGKDINDRLRRFLERNALDFTHTEVMKSTVKRSRDQAKDRKVHAVAGSHPIRDDGDDTCYGEFNYGNSDSMKHSAASNTAADDDDDDDDDQSNNEWHFINRAMAHEVSMDNGVNIRIGMSTAQNDERGDQGLARTVDKNT